MKQFISSENKEKALKYILENCRETEWHTLCLDKEEIINKLPKILGGLSETETIMLLNSMVSDGIIKNDGSFSHIEPTQIGLEYFDNQRRIKSEKRVEFWKNFFTQFITGFASGLIVAILGAYLLIRFGLAKG